MTGLKARIAQSVSDIEPSIWDACAFPGGVVDCPFLSHAFFEALESSGSAAPSSGWGPAHVLVEAENGAPAGLMPLYLKSHSYGEYVFDHGWADAFERAGGRYYPKLQCAVPFTPVTSRRLWVADGQNAEDVESALLSAAMAVAERMKASSLHLTFLTEGEYTRLGAAGFLQRTDQQFHWKNEGYGSFADFLEALASRKRKALKKERAAAFAPGIEIRWITGGDITEDHWDAFFHFYLDTGSRKWGQPYLNREFFSRIGETMADKVLLIYAYRGGEPIAGALNIIGSEALYGRYWGCTEHVPFLHFEICYYQAIDYAIAHGLKTVEAGAQGEHKLARGYVPTKTYSAHWIAHPGLRNAVADFLQHERQAVDADIRHLEGYAPFRKGD